MRKVRLVTMIGLLLACSALFAIPYSLPLAIITGSCGVVISVIALVTSPDNDQW